MSTLSIFFFNGFDLALFFGDLNQREKLSQIKSPYFSQALKKKAGLKNSKCPPQKTLIFQLRQFSIFFHEFFMDWSLGW